ncbi:4940_t:CDS:2 [Gigaspora margarita]|uniref:4940_t:CDS:1 n=1 Tax=Gigaspora margarita TaxID=4874 RepID=A0ABN7VEU0_GIGMA|nr:4940_t:CDS:2 [Gigaspora margarita]
MSSTNHLEDGSFIKNQLRNILCNKSIRIVAHLLKINLETPLFPKDGIEERKGLIMLSKESAVQENQINNILQLDKELKIIKELEEIIYEIDHKKLNLNINLCIMQQSIVEL